MEVYLQTHRTFEEPHTRQVCYHETQEGQLLGSVLRPIPLGDATRALRWTGPAARRDSKTVSPVNVTTH